ncbi:MAG TPA: phosphatidylglycerophosphatase A [Thermodesulfovibrionia bacterium]|nr:phosphatidylglycerophosphatase A [Thermodesulfovibrionia bacterium]
MTRKDKLFLLIGSAFGLGLLPIAPGSWAALLGVIIHVISVLLLPSPLHCTIVLIFALFLVSLANHLLTPWAVQYWNKKDPGNFVLDEVAGYLLVPILFHHGKLWQVALWGFLIFRIFDIIKLPIARQIDRNVTGPWGILLDDLVSAVYTVFALYCLMWIGESLQIDWLLITRSQ